MCPPDEIYQRSEVENGAKANFESKPGGPDRDNFAYLAVKRFDRRAAGKIAEAKDIRPPVLLYHTLCYLRDCIVDQERIPKG